MVNTLMLRGRMIERGFTQDSLAAAIKMSRSALNQKLKSGGDGGREFTVGEANAIAKAIPLTADEAMKIFFADVVADTRQ